MRRPFFITVIALVCIVGTLTSGCSTAAPPAELGADNQAGSLESNDAVFARAFEDQAHNLWVQGEGTVSRLLTDDDDGDRHQRFIVTLDSGQTLLMTHNIDIAPRLDSLQVGDTISFRGEYEWNDEGGVVHWTHHDPSGGIPGGWIEHHDRVYR